MEGLYLVEGQLAKPSFSSSHISTTDPKKSKSGLRLWLSLCPHKTIVGYQSPSVSHTL